MSNNEATAAAIEGPPSPLLAAAGRRMSLLPTEPADRLDQLTQAFGGAASPAQPIPSALTNDNQPADQQQPKSWGSTLFGHFDWTGNKKTSPDVEAIYEKTSSEDNPMRYKRTKARRVSLITSDGSVFNFDVPAADSRGVSAQQSMTPVTPQDASMFIQVGGAGAAGQPMLQDPAEVRQEAVAPRPEIEVTEPITHRSVARRGSLTDIVVQENIKASEKLPVILEVAASDSSSSPDKEEARRKKKSSVFDTWFFRNPDYKEEGEEDHVSPAASRKPSTVVEPELGDGKLTRKVIVALGMAGATTPKKEARDMNVWMPQPGF